jgi:ABC-type sugar transport system ATPase subunit
MAHRPDVAVRIGLVAIENFARLDFGFLSAVRALGADRLGAAASSIVTADGFRTEDGIVLPTSGRPGNAAIYGIRPENIHLDPNGIEVKIVVLEPTGSETLVIAKLGNHSINCVIRERIRVAPGDTLRICPDVSAVHLFDTGGART